ncbi:MAG: hypothetical protein COV76_01495 [Candidatus Omnitrophica bacterium CG11_big_fil_rev_8_21_14_0_20_64_10]|nr:MAG: hypothetical protein COV76_01495 [Candidatus Omnitrophica bacterium CG11_big_fil_rev_8_21_14_0_20_64_10]
MTETERGAGWPPARTIGRSALPLLFFVIPYSNAAIEILFFVLLACWLIGWGIPRPGNFPVEPGPGRPVGFWLIVYLTICGVTVFFSTHPGLSIAGWIRKTLEYGFFFFIAGRIAETPGVLRRCLRALVTVTLLVLLHSFLQQQAVWGNTHPGLVIADPVLGKPLIYGRFMGPYTNPNDLATLLMMAAAIALVRIHWTGRLFSSGFTLLLAMLLIAIIGTRSRASMIGLTAAAVLLLCLKPGRWRFWIPAGIGLLAANGYMFFQTDAWGKLAALRDASSIERLIWFKTAWQMFLDKPLLGQGLNTFMANYDRFVGQGTAGGPAYAHNCYLQIAAETGLVGLSLFLVFGITGAIHAIRAIRTPSADDPRMIRVDLAAGLAALTAFAVQIAFDTQLYALRQSALFWTLAGAVWGTARTLRHDRSTGAA